MARIALLVRVRQRRDNGVTARPIEPLACNCPALSLVARGERPIMGPVSATSLP
jgi:hypothetical protein